ncbi:MAG: hypothetical protein WCK02_09000 [Bacteroidota bacterium]
MKQLLKDSFIPQKPLLILSYVLIISIPIIRFILNYWMNGFEDLGVLTIYRSNVGDIQYFQSIEALSKFNFSEVNILENIGHGVQGFPFASLLIDAFFFKIFGSLGFLVADILIFYLFFSTLVLLFRIIGSGTKTAVIVSVIISSSLIENLAPFILPEHFQWSFRLWGLRIPRPFITEIFIILTFCINFYLLKNPKSKSKLILFSLGATLAILTNMDLFAGFQLLIIQLYVMFFIVENWKDYKTWIIKLLWISSGFIVFIFPFLLQQYYIDPETTIRNGIINNPTFPHLLHLLLDLKPYLFIQITLITILFTIIWGLNKIYLKHDENFRIYSYLSLLLAISLFSAFFFSIITNKIVHPHQFIDRLDRYLSYSIIFIFIFLIMLVKKLDVSLNNSMFNQKIRTYLLIIFISILSVSAIKIIFSAKKNAQISSHLTPKLYDIKNYRQNFNELALELNKINTVRPLVLGTLDHQVRVYWQVFGHQYSYLPDVFCTTVSDNFAEKRYANFSKIIGLDSNQYSILTNKPSSILFGFPGFKYIANNMFQYSSSDDYYESDKIQMMQTNAFDLNIIVPKSAKKRLIEMFKLSNNLPIGQLDYIVLQKDDILDSISDIKNAKLVFKNEVFRLYRVMNSRKNTNK